MVGSIVVLGVLTCCALLYFVCNLKLAQMDMQHRIPGFMLHEFELSHNTAEETKNICCTKDKSTVDLSTVTISIYK